MKEKGVDFVKWFSELNKNSVNIAGGKGANLAEIYNMKIPVPPGFVVTAQAYNYFIENSGLKEKIQKLLSEIDYENTKQLDEITKQIRALILNSKLPKEMQDEIIESYEILNARNTESEQNSPLDILKNSPESIFVAVRSSATAEDLADASFAGQQDSFINVKGKLELIEHIKKCFASLFTSRATYYRNKKGFEHSKVSLAVVVQKMIDSEKSGVIFSKDPSNKNNNVIIEAVWGLGEGIVSGMITPDKYIVSPELKILDVQLSNKKIALTRNSAGEKITVNLRDEKSRSQVLKGYEIAKLTNIALNLEEHYQKPQDIEFAIEGEEIFIVQTRPITTIEKRSEEIKELKGEVILTGMAASPGIASGKIKIISKMEDLDRIEQGEILVTKMTNPDMVVTMQKASAIVTDDGGMTAHAAIVSREMGIPAVVGTREATTKLKEGEIITVNGSTGKIYKGKIAETTEKEVLPATAITKTKVKVIVDLPSFAKRAAKAGIKFVGLTRIEGIIAESGKHPNYFLEKNEISEYEEIIFRGVKEIAEYFNGIWVRTSDIRSDEFQNLDGALKEKEANPMLGMHGIRFGIKNPEILKAELRALKKISDRGKEIGVLLPQIISVEEVRRVKEFLKEINFTDAKLGIMIETPASVQLIKDFCMEGINFISFGTNDLTQYILAVDRGNEKVQHLYDEMHPAVLYQIEYVIRVCKRNGVETSICGQAGSEKEMVKFLVEKGIDSISVNADMAKEISDYIAEIENELVKNTDKEPRKYHLKKQSEIKNLQNEEGVHLPILEPFPEINGVKCLDEETENIEDETQVGAEINEFEDKNELSEEQIEIIKQEDEVSVGNSDEENVVEAEELTDEEPEFKTKEDLKKMEEDEVLDIF